MKRLLTIWMWAAGALWAVAQQVADPVVLTVAGEPVTRSEFEYSYNKNNADGVIDRKTVNEYVDLFVNYKLKVRAARDAGIDTTSAFRAEFAQYRDQQVRPMLVTDDDMLAEAHQVYDQTVQQIGPRGLIKPAHILIRLSQKATQAEMDAARVRIDSIYQALTAGANFAELARQVSQDPGSAARGGELSWFGPNQLLKEFEDAAYALQPGEMSRPVLSPAGWHVILMQERKQLEPFEYHKANLLRYLEQRDARESIAERKIEARAKQERVTEGELMTQLADSLSADNDDLRHLIREYYEGLLLYEISNRAVWEPTAKDDAALAAYFKQNRKRYAWDEPRFKGIAYHVKTKADVKAVKQCVKHLPFDQWNEALRRTFNPDSVIRIRVEKGIFKKGDNKLIDRQAFKQPVTVEPVKDYPYDAVFGKMLKKGPENYTDVRGLVVSDLQEQMERRWVAGLRQKYSYEVNQEVLKTVNNH